MYSLHNDFIDEFLWFLGFGFRFGIVHVPSFVFFFGFWFVMPPHR